MSQLKNLIKTILKENRDIKQEDINMEEMENMIKKGAIALDVRSPQEYKEGHINGAVLLPEYELKTKVNETLPNKEQTIIVYCSSGVRSKKVQKELKKLGYKNVYNLYNGFENY